MILPNALRLSVGTLTIFRVPPPTSVDARTARRAMLLAPAVGLVVGLIAEGVALVIRTAIDGYSDRLLVAVAAVSASAALTRGMHLDGVADTFDGLGSGKHGQHAVEVMRRSDVGPMGVAALVLILLSQVAALYTALLVGRGTLALVGGLVVSRLAIAWACRRGVLPNRPNGLGSTFANTVPVGALMLLTVAVALFLSGTVIWDDDVSYAFIVNALLAMVAALCASQLFVRRCVSRFGGISGDIMGAACECAFLVFLVVIALD